MKTDKYVLWEVNYRFSSMTFFIIADTFDQAGARAQRVRTKQSTNPGPIVGLKRVGTIDYVPKMKKPYIQNTI